MNNEKEIQTLKNQVNCLVYQLVKINKILARMTTQLELQEVRQLIAENLRILESLRSRAPHPAPPIRQSQAAKNC
ncbi:hypothetical protein [Microseira wollei]|uniref:Uncharacterized protein n=1 Tax=Microseira wollei NIES-4236 TaxID=2530354 RepID=A0AAV3XPV4_9CYAN|nr:hypothetical protein [Microseira wollei]GET43746.1 hypothetical protein MiSe_85710 [Microseira wollei NIES-4236]